MKIINQRKIAKRAGLSESMLSRILNGDRVPSKELAQKLAKATGTDPMIWIFSTPTQIKTAIRKAM